MNTKIDLVNNNMFNVLSLAKDSEDYITMIIKEETMVCRLILKFPK